MMVLDRLVDDARLLDPAADLAGCVEQHRSLTGRAGTIGRLVVLDHDLSRLVRRVPPGRPLPVSVVTTSGAGGLVSLGRRSWPELVIGAAVSTLRDLDDVAGNAARVVAAAAELAPEVEVVVGLPYAPGWQRAIEVVEAAGGLAQIDLAGVTPAVAVAQLSALVEADLAFKVSGLPASGLPSLLVTVAALVDDAGLSEAARLLAGDPDRAAEVVAGWDEATQTRVRRRLRSCDSPDPAATLAQLTSAGLLER